MKFDIPSALIYPFRKQNRMNTLLYPGLAQYGFYLSLSLLTPGIILSYNPLTIDAEHYKQILILSTGLSIVAIYLISALTSGFSWQLLDHFKTEGLEAAAPQWPGAVGKLWRDGLKLNLYYLCWIFPFLLLGALPLLLADLQNGQMIELKPRVLDEIQLMTYGLYFFLAPFINAPIVTSAENRTLGNLFNLNNLVDCGRQHYKPILTATLLYGGLILIFIIVFTVLVILSCYSAFLALPFLMSAMSATGTHLLAQACFKPEQERPLEKNSAIPQSED